MLKSILKMSGVKPLTKEEQKSLKGGRCGDGCDPELECCHYCQWNACIYRSCSSCLVPSHPGPSPLSFINLLFDGKIK